MVVGVRTDPRPRIDVALDVAILGLRLGGVVVISPDGSWYFGEGRGDGIGMSVTE